MFNESGLVQDEDVDSVDRSYAFVVDNSRGFSCVLVAKGRQTLGRCRRWGYPSGFMSTDYRVRLHLVPLSHPCTKVYVPDGSLGPGVRMQECCLGRDLYSVNKERSPPTSLISFSQPFLFLSITYPLVVLHQVKVLRRSDLESLVEYKKALRKKNSRG